MDPRGWRCDKPIDLLQLFNFHLFPHLRFLFILSPHAWFYPSQSPLNVLSVSLSQFSSLLIASFEIYGACMRLTRGKELMWIMTHSISSTVKWFEKTGSKNITFSETYCHCLIFDDISFETVYCHRKISLSVKYLLTLTSSEVTPVVCIWLEGRKAVKWSLAATLYH